MDKHKINEIEAGKFEEVSYAQAIQSLKETLKELSPGDTRKTEIIKAALDEQEEKGKQA